MRSACRRGQCSPKTLFTTENLAKLPADKQIVSYCYSGQTASQVTGALRMLGYDAYKIHIGMPSLAIFPGVSVGVWDVSKSLNQPLFLGAKATRAAATTTAAPAPAALPTTGGPLFGLILAGLGLTGAGLALRKRERPFALDKKPDRCQRTRFLTYLEEPNDHHTTHVVPDTRGPRRLAVGDYAPGGLQRRTCAYACACANCRCRGADHRPDRTQRHRGAAHRAANHRHPGAHQHSCARANRHGHRSAGRGTGRD